MPTVAILPPPIAALEQDEDAYTQANLMALRNCTLINMIDGCAISLPASRPGEAPVGLMIAGLAGQDARILAIAAGVEALLRLTAQSVRADSRRAWAWNSTSLPRTICPETKKPSAFRSPESLRTMSSSPAVSKSAIWASVA